MRNTLKIIAEFKIPYYQYLTEEGVLTKEPPHPMSVETIKLYYRTMLLIEAFDKKAIALQRTGKMGTYAPITGQEAIGTALGVLLEKNDLFVPYYRDYATLYLRGIKLEDILTFWGGNERSSFYSGLSHDFPICVPIASQCLHAAGIATALRYKKSRQIALVTLGDGATSEGDFYEAINLAGVWNLPIVFVILNNKWAISVPYDKQTKCQTLAQKAIAAGIEGIQVDGNDVFALHSVINSAIAKARGPNSKPQLIEAMTYRLSDHTTADDATRYQPSEEVLLAKKRSPIKRLHQYILANQILDESAIEQMKQVITTEVEGITDAYLNKPIATIKEAFDFQYASLPEYLIEQRAEAIEEFAHAHG